MSTGKGLLKNSILLEVIYSHQQKALPLTSCGLHHDCHYTNFHEAAWLTHITRPITCFDRSDSSLLCRIQRGFRYLSVTSLLKKKHLWLKSQACRSHAARRGTTRTRTWQQSGQKTFLFSWYLREEICREDTKQIQNHGFMAILIWLCQLLVLQYSLCLQATLHLHCDQGIQIPYLTQ